MKSSDTKRGQPPTKTYHVNGWEYRYNRSLLCWEAVKDGRTVRAWYRDELMFGIREDTATEFTDITPTLVARGKLSA